MPVTAALLILVVALSMAILATARDRRSPLTWSLWLWVAVAALIATRALPLVYVNGTAALVISVGLIALTTPMLARRRPRNPVTQGHRGVSGARFLLLSVVVLAMVLYGAWAFRSGIAAAVGTDFDALDLRQVRLAQNGVGRGGGIGTLLAAANPVLACLGVYGAYRFNRAFIAFIGVALVAAFQNPARTSSLSLVVITVVFWIYARNALSRSDKPVKTRTLPVRRLAIVGVLIVVAFLVIGDLLQKSSLAGVFTTWLPGWAIDPVLYYTGGASALSVASETGVAPIAFGSSIFVVLRALSVIAPAVESPDTIGQFVAIPVPFNVYTGFGQVYFDFGILGVIILSLLLGWLSIGAHRAAERGALEWAWVSGVTASLLLSLPQGFRLFNLDVTFQLVVGFLVFGLIRRSRLTAGHRRRRTAIDARAATADSVRTTGPHGER